MRSKIDDFYLQKTEPVRGALMALRKIILECDPRISESWKYGMPFFCYQGKMFCYLWVHPKKKLPYLGIVEGSRIQHPGLVAGNRSRMKIMLFDPGKDLPLQTINLVLGKAIDLYVTGKIKTTKKQFTKTLIAN